MPKALTTPRRAMCDVISTAMATWLETMRSESFHGPVDDEQLDMILEAVASAVKAAAQDSPNRDALLEAFALEILDAVTPKST
jgi:hypothetical protein